MCVSTHEGLSYRCLLWDQEACMSLLATLVGAFLDFSLEIQYNCGKLNLQILLFSHFFVSNISNFLESPLRDFVLVWAV